MATGTYLEGPWHGIDIKRAAVDPRYAVHYMNDFVYDSTLASVASPYLVSGNATIDHDTKADAGPGGVLIFIPETGTQNHEALMQLDGVAGAWCPGGSYGVLAFEARVAATVVTEVSWFIGLCEHAKTANLLLDTTGSPATTLNANADLIGFNVLDDDSDSLDLCYGKNGAALQTELAVQALTASTYYRLGLRYDPGTDDVTFYIDGVKVKQFSAVGNTTFPDGEEMSPMLAVKLTDASGTTAPTWLDWWMCTQLRV